MIKLEVEIKNEEFIFTYFVGGENQSSTSPLSADALIAFNDLLRMCSTINKWRNKEFERELWGKAYVEKLEKEKS